MLTTGAARAERGRRFAGATPAAWGPLRQVLYVGSLGAFALLMAAIDVLELRNSFFGWDFRAFYEGGRDYLHLHSPYVSGSLAQLTSHQNFVYPIPTAALFAPLSLLPYHLALGLFVCGSGVLLAAALYLLGVRDVRCYVAVFVGAPAFDGLQLGTISPILVFLLAVIWRYRDRVWIVALALALAILTKIFLWPLAIWLLVTRRLRSVSIAAAVSLAALVLAALPVGFDVLLHYPALLRAVSSFEGTSSLSLVGLGAAATGSGSAGAALSLVAGLLLLLTAVRSGWKGEDSYAFRLSVVAALALTPIVWNHYLALLFVPLALTRPRFSPIWLGTGWVLGAVATTMRGAPLAAAIGAICLIAFVQAGVQDRIRSRFPRFPAPRLAGSLALWVALVGVLVAALPVVPAVAALRSPFGSTAVSGTAEIRLIRSGTICLRVRTRGVELPAFVKLVDDRSGALLLERRLDSADAESCGRYRSQHGSANLATRFADRRVRLSLRIVSPSGRDLLAGPILRLKDSASAG